MKLFKKFLGEFIKRIPGALIVSLIWLLLGWALSFVKQALFFVPISFLTGNLLGIDEGSIIGGVVGKTILMLTFSSFFTTLVVTKGGFKVRFKAAVSGYVSAILDMIPYFKSFKDFPFKDKNARRLGIAGIGFGLISYAFVSGDGSAINSFVCIIIFLKIAQEVVNQRGIITAVLNLIISRFGKKPISRKPTDYFVSGSGIGMLIGVIYAFVFGNQMLAYIIGASVFLFGLVAYQIERKTMQKLLKQAAATTAVVMIIVAQTIPFWAESTTYKKIDYWKEAVLCESLPVWAKNQNSWTIEKLEKDGVSIPVNTDLSFEPYLNILLGKQEGELPTYSITLTDISAPLLDSTTGNYVLEASNQKITISFSPQMGRDIKGSIRIQGTYKAYYKTSANDDVWEEAEEFIIDKTCEASFFEQVVDDYANGTVETEREFRVSGAAREMMQELVMLDGSIKNELFSIVYPSLCFEKFTNGKVHESTGTPLNYIGSATLVQESRNDYVITNTQKDGESVALEEMQLGAHNYINILNGTENGELPKYSFEIHEYKQPFLKIYGLSEYGPISNLQVIEQKMYVEYTPGLGVYFPFKIAIEGIYAITYVIQDDMGDYLYSSGTVTMNYMGDIRYENCTSPSEGAEARMLCGIVDISSEALHHFVSFDREIQSDNINITLNIPMLYVENFAYDRAYIAEDKNPGEDVEPPVVDTEITDTEASTDSDVSDDIILEEDMAKTSVLIASSAIVACGCSAISTVISTLANTSSSIMSGVQSGSESVVDNAQTSLAEQIDHWLSEKGCHCELVINEGADYPDVVCEKNKVVEIPVRVEGTTTGQWIFAAICLLEQDQKKMIKSICVPIGEKEALVTVMLEGNEIVKESKVYCTIIGYNGESDTKGIVGIADFTLTLDEQANKK